MTRFANVPGHTTERHKHLGPGISVVHTRNRPTGEQRDTVNHPDFTRESANAGRIDAANFRRPFGCLWHTIVRAKYIIFEILFRVCALRHVIFIESNRATIEEIPIDQWIRFGIVLHEQGVCHTQQHRVIGRRTNRNPFVRQHRSRVVVEWIDEDKFGAGFFRCLEKVHRVTLRAPRRVLAPNDDQLRVTHIHPIIMAGNRQAVA